jgi:hypothetical protein
VDTSSNVAEVKVSEAVVNRVVLKYIDKKTNEARGGRGGGRGRGGVRARARARRRLRATWHSAAAARPSQG